MRASPRRFPNALGPTPRALAACAIAAGLALSAAAALCTDAPAAGGSVEGRAVAAAKRAATQAEARAKALDAMAGVQQTKAPARPAAASKPAAPARPPAPAKATVPLKATVPVMKAAAPAKAVAAPNPATARPNAPVPAKAPTPARPAVPAHNSAPVKPGVPAKAPTPVKPGAEKGALAGGARPQVAAVAASMRPTMTTVPAPAAHLDDQVTYQYNALGRRDPFMPLVGGSMYVPIDAPPDIGGIQVVGIVWGTQDRFAIIEDGRGNSSVLRPGDKVMNGVVESLKRDGVVVSITVDGQSQSVTIPLTRKGDSNADH